MGCLNTKAHSKSKHQWSHLSHMYSLDYLQYSSYTLQVKLAFTLLGGFMSQLKDKRFYETMYTVYYLDKLYVIHSLQNKEPWLCASLLCKLNWEDGSELQRLVQKLWSDFFKQRFPLCIGLRRALTFCCYVYIQSVTKMSHGGCKREDFKTDHVLRTNLKINTVRNTERNMKN